MEYVVVVDTDGMLTGLWSDELIGLYEVEKGGVTVERVSHVEFCDGCLGWHVWEVDMDAYMTPRKFETRADALAWEKEEIERRLIEGI